MKATYVNAVPSRRSCRKGRKTMKHKIIEYLDRFANSNEAVLKIDPEDDYVSVVSLYNNVRKVINETKRTTTMIAYVRGNSVYVEKF
jgi:hypothetical protein